MSELAPLAAAPRALRAAEAVVEPVPPCATESAVVKPLSDVMSLLAPLAAAPRAVRAAAAVAAPVPPLATETGVESERVTSPLVPPPVKPVPAVTLVMSPTPERELAVVHERVPEPWVLRTLQQEGACDLSYSLPERARFRVNIFRQRGSFAIVMRVIASKF